MSDHTCTSCSKDAGSGSTCQHCGARVYRYAIDEPLETSGSGSHSDLEIDDHFDLDLIAPSRSPQVPSREPSPGATSFEELTKPTSTVPPRAEGRFPQPPRQPTPLPRRRRSFRLYIFVAFFIIQILRRILDNF